MAANWQIFFRHTPDGLLAIALDAAGGNRPDRAALGTLLSLHITPLEVRENNFPSRADFDAIYALEDALAEALDPHDAAYIGRVTQSGECVLHIYTNAPDGTSRALAPCLEPFGERVFVEERADAGWELYQSLYPTADEWQYISNDAVLRNLTEHGDDLSKPRRVDHWLYFPDTESRDRVERLLLGQRFVVVGKDDKGKPPRPCKLQVWRIDSVQRDHIGQLTIALSHLCQEHGGQYDGWETSVEKP